MITIRPESSEEMKSLGRDIRARFQYCKISGMTIEEVRISESLYRTLQSFEKRLASLERKGS